LGGCEFLHQILAAYGNLHRCPLRSRLLNFAFGNRHTPTFNPEACFLLASLYTTAGPSGNGCLFFLLIVFIFCLKRAWKRGQFSGFQGLQRMRVFLPSVC
jgi:hypothetical protein